MAAQLIGLMAILGYLALRFVIPFCLTCAFGWLVQELILDPNG